MIVPIKPPIISPAQRLIHANKEVKLLRADIATIAEQLREQGKAHEIEMVEVLTTHLAQMSELNAGIVERVAHLKDVIDALQDELAESQTDLGESRIKNVVQEEQLKEREKKIDELWGRVRDLENDGGEPTTNYKPLEIKT